jgi:hypothetical protein
MECNGGMYNQNNKNKTTSFGRNQVRISGSRLMYSIKRTKGHVILGSITTKRCKENLVTGGE